MHIWILKIQDASMVMKGRGRILPFKNIFKGIVICTRCEEGTDNE